MNETVAVLQGPIDIFNAATMLIKQHGQGAAVVATFNAAMQDSLNNKTAASAWRDVVEAIKILEGTERPGGEILN
jgi:hypothetical protein